MDQPLCRFVLWRHNNELPIWRMVPYTPGQPIQLRDLPWLAATCGDILGLTIFEQFLYEYGEWTVQTLQDGEVSVLADSPIVLLRVHGVELCPLFGHELAAFDRNLGYYYDPTLLPEVDNRIEEPGAIRDIRVVAWTASAEHPKVHQINFNDDNTVKLGRHYYLHKDLGRRETVNMWIPGGSEWEGGISVNRRFWVEARYNTILVKLAEVGSAVGLGRELMALEPVGQLRRGHRMVFVCPERYMDLARAVSPGYDIAIPTRIQARLDGEGDDEEGGDGDGGDGDGDDGDGDDEEGDDEDETVMTVGSVDPRADTGSSTIPCKRSADAEDGSPRPSRRLKLTS